MMHLGSRVSALLDGRLPLHEEERAWAHVHECHPCRDLVEREGWVKTQLAGLSMADRTGREAPDRLKHSLLASARDDGPAPMLAPVPFATVSTRSRHRSLAAIGGGAAGAAVVGLLALGSPLTSQQLDRRAPVTDLGRPIQTATPTVDRTQDRVARRRGARDDLRKTSPGASTPAVVVVSKGPRVTMAP
ncbi:hypothetical protein [Nocardioides piscis]|uniref:Zinc-finger domain-containing protein n=1 Tax=Nocardioides piscis TaxID=2714938 RepID=A0A6G7YBW4_9ACTN|nr:hypothetical protein [Nocardioides piscis]QIK74141.1 hypothetical protein G7071_00490 [Nocardioides piscis]